MTTTKLYVPEFRVELVSRPRLVERLEAGAGCRLVLVSAPAGFGKTTLVAEWARHSGRSVAWLSLDAGDDDPACFWRYVVAAIRTVENGVGESVLAALQSPQLPPLEPLVSALINDLAGALSPLTLVLDDYHIVEDAAIHHSVELFLDRLPPQLRVMIVTRADPPLPLSRWRGRSELVELRASDLRFTPEEAAQFLNAIAGLGLTTEDVAALEARTEGWIVGLQMAALALQAALSLQESTDRHDFVAAFAGDDRYIHDYLVEEVFCRQSAQVQDFLLRTSVLERMCEPLCDAVTGRGDGRETLEYLESANLFLVPLDNRRQWYRYHHLFADLLRQRLHRSTEGEELAALYLRASEWYESEGLIAEAVSQALAAPDFARAAALVEHHGIPLLFRGEVLLVQRWLATLDEEAIRSRPALCVVYAWARFLSTLTWYHPHPVEAVEPWLEHVEGALDQSDGADAATREWVTGHVATLQALLSFYHFDDRERVIDVSHQSLERIPESDLALRSVVLQNLGIVNLTADPEAAERAFAEARRAWAGDVAPLVPFTAIGEQIWVAAWWRGRLREASEICRKALRSINDPSPTAGEIYSELGLILLEWGDLEEADRVLHRGMELIELGPWPNRQAHAYDSLVRLKQAQGDPAGAFDLIACMGEVSSSAASHAADLRVQLGLVQAARESHHLTFALEWARACGIVLDECDDDAFFHQEPRTLVRVRIAQHRMRGGVDLQPVFRFLDRYLRHAEKWRVPIRAIEALCLRAMALQAQGDTPQAVAAVQRALVLGEPEGYVYSFVREGPPLAALLSLAAPGHVSSAYSSKLLTAFSVSGCGDVTVPDPHSSALPEPLTPREMEVLRLVAAGASNPEIARQLFVTLNTVKRHVTHILGKLGVSNRTQAATRARDLGLVE